MTSPIARQAVPAFAEASAAFETPWAVAIGDFAYPETRGEGPPDFERSQLFQVGLIRLIAEDLEVHKLSTEVNHLIKPRSALRDPALVRRVTALIQPG